MSDDKWRYDVALSFAGEDRNYVEQVAASLREMAIEVFYDDYEKVSLWGVDLYEHLAYVYEEAARFCVIFASKSYADKVWTNHERQNAQARALTSKGEYILPARFDQTKIPGLRSSIGYIDLTTMEPVVVAKLIKQKLGLRRSAAGFPNNPDRLYEAMGADQGDASERREEIRKVAISFYEALGRMTREERKAVCGVFAFGCPGELPEGVHISLDYLSRMIELPRVQALEGLTAVRSLNFKASLRPPLHDDGPEVLSPDDQDIFLTFWSSREPACSDSNEIVYRAVEGAAHHFCAEHGLEVVVNRDFHKLSKLTDAEEGVLAPKTES